MDYKFIAIEGNIGAGKTSLSKKIAEQFNAKLVMEQFSDNSFLPKFYKDPNRYSFPLELSFLAERFHQLKNEISHELFSTFIVSDYYFTKSLIFAKCTLAIDEYNLYRRLFNIIYQSLPKPDLYVYLYLKPENSLANIKKRGRNYERNIEASYLETIQNGYFRFFKENKNDYRFLIIDTNDIDFVNYGGDYEKIADVIFKNNYEFGINRIKL